PGPRYESGHIGHGETDPGKIAFGRRAGYRAWVTGSEKQRARVRNHTTISFARAFPIQRHADHRWQTSWQRGLFVHFARRHSNDVTLSRARDNSFEPLAV